MEKENENNKNFDLEKELKTTQEKIIEIINKSNNELRNLIIEKNIEKIETIEIPKVEDFENTTEEIKQEIKEELEDF